MRNTNRLLIKFSVSLTVTTICLSWLLYHHDKSKINSGNNPIFTVPIIHYKDGGTIYYIGLGYGVFKWKRLVDKNISGKLVHGYLEGNEIVIFPECYKVLINRNGYPKKELIFKANQIKK